MDELEKLFNVLSRDGYYTKSFEEFQTQYNDPAYRDKVFSVVTRDRLFTKTREDFDAKYSPSGVETVEVETEVQEEEPIKKKSFLERITDKVQGTTESISEDGLSESQEIEVEDPQAPPSGGETVEVETEVEVEAPQVLPSSDGVIKQSFLDRLGEKAQRSIDKKEEYQTYNPAVATKSATADFTQYKDYLPQGVETIPNAKQVLEGDYNPVVPFDQAEYEKNKEAYQIIYNNKVKDYEEYLKGEQGYIKGYNGKYYSSDKFSPETILEKELATLRSRDGNLMDRGDEAIVDRISERLGKFGFDVKYDPSIINIPEGRLGASATITSQHTGEDVTIGLDTLSLGSDKKELDKLNAFVLKNFDEDKVDVKDLLEGLSAQDKAVMGAEAERKYETLSVGRTISDAEDMVVGIDKQIEAANKMLEEAQAMPDYEEAVSTSVGSGMLMGTSLRGVNKKKALKLKQAKAQLEYLNQQKKETDALLRSAEEGKQVQATKFASKVLGEQMMTESERLENEAKELSYTKKVSDDIDSRLKAAAEKAKTATTQEEINDIAAQREDDVNTFNELARIRKEQINNYNLDKENLRKDVGRKVILDAQVGGLTGSVVRSVVSGVGSTMEGFYELFVGDLAPNIINMFYNEDDEGYITDAERKEFKKDSIQDDLVGYVSDEFGITDEAMESYRKGLSLQDMIKNVKEGKEALEGSNWFTEGIYGMIESLPAIATSLITPQASIASFAAMGINGLNKEMESNPMFANVSENEKLLLTLPYGVVIGVLENYGFRNALNNSSLISKIMFKALKKSKRTTNRNFRELVVDEIENKVLKGGTLLAASTFSEMETGAAQQAVEGYMKEAYDVAKGMDYFKQSIDFLDGKYITKEFLDEVWKAGLSEAVGGFAMGAMPAISQARKNNTIAEIPIGAFMVYEKAMLDPAIRRAQTMRITEQVELGLKTKEEAAKEVQDYDITIGQLRAIPQEFDLKSRQQILALESQKKILEDQIEGKSVFTTREQQRQIKVLEERIEEVSANAQKGEAKKSNQDILTEEFVKSATKEEVVPEDVAVEEEVTTEEAPVDEDVTEDVTQEQLDEVRALEEEAPVVEEEVTTEEAPVTKEEQDAKDKARAERLAELDRILREATTEKAPVAETQEVVEDKARAERLAELDRILREATTEKAPVTEEEQEPKTETAGMRLFKNEEKLRKDKELRIKEAEQRAERIKKIKELEKSKRKGPRKLLKAKVPEVTQEQEDSYNNNEISQEEIKDILRGVYAKRQTRSDEVFAKVKEKDMSPELTVFERKVLKDNSELYSDILATEPISTLFDRFTGKPKTETKTKAPKKKAPKKEVKVETPKKEAPKKEAPKKVETTSKINEIENEIEDIQIRLETAQEEIQNERDNYKDEAQRIKEEKAKVRKDKTLSKAKKEDKLDDLEAERDGFMNDRDAAIENYQFDLAEEKRELKKAKSKIEKLKNKLDTTQETSKKEAPKKETGLDAKLRAIAVKKIAANKDRKTYKATKAEQKLINDNKKQYAKIFTEEKMPTTTSDGIRSAIKMVEDSFKEKEAKLKEQIKTIDDRVTDRMTKDKERQKKKDELSKARKEKNAKVKELKGKLKDMGAKFRLSDDVVSETEEGFITEDEIVEGMKKLGPVEKGFKIPSGIKEGDVDPIAQSKSTKKITDAQAKKLGFKSVADMLKNIQEFNGIPMIVAMSDVLASGVAKDSMGNDMKVDGGLLYNVLGSNTELAWAGVNETGAEVQFREAQQMYRANKELFDRLWKEGKLPQNHVPMVVLRMGNSAINSNEAMFRYLAPLIKSFPKQNQDEAFSVLMESIEGKKNVSQEKKSGRDTVKSAKQLEEIINKNNITDVGSLFDFIVKDAKKRAKGDNENTIPLPTRALLFDLVVSPTGVKKPSKGVAKALIKDTQSEGKEFLADKILSDIGETSMMESESGDAVAIMGVDVINGGVRKANHNNYGFGPKGRLIALIKNPMNGLNIFPEWRAKAVRVFKKDAKGEMPTLEKVLRQVGGAFFIDKAFRGARVQTEQSDIDVISGKMRFAFPGVSVSQTQQEFDEALKQEGIRTAESNGNTILGLTKDGKIFLNPSRKSLSTPIHEFGHIWIDFLRSESSKTKGTKLLKKGLELVEGTKALESAIKKYGDNELAREEALVELMGTKGETIANAAKKAKFIEWFNAFFKYIKEKLTRFKDVKVKDIKDISLEDFVDIGLAELFSGQAVDKDADVKFKPEEAATSAKARMQIIGENAQLSQQVRENLSVAKEMQALGTNSKLEIFLSTGWQQGKDSMWRYEIPDGEINKEEISDLYLGTFNEVIASQTVKITDILEAPELYKAYPSLKNIPVVFTKDKYMDGADGSYSPGVFNMIRLNENLLKGKDIFELKSILLHEVQHAIQHEEGFATGGNLGTGRQLLNTRFADQTRYKKHLRDIIKRIRDLNTIEVRKIEDVLAQNPDIEVYEFEKIAEQLIINAGASKKYIKPRAVKVKKLLEGLNDMNIEVGSNMSEDIDNTIDSIYKEIKNIKSPSSAYEAYKRIAGEVEARNVQARMNLSEEERRGISLEGTEDVAREQQLLLFNRGRATKPMASMKEKGVDLKGAIEKVIARARAKEISDNVIIAYLMEDKGFDRKKALATIKRVNRKNLRSAIKSLFASVKDITNISEQEAELVKELLKYDRATTRADKAIQKKAKEELLAQVSVMARASKGKISAAQLSAVLSRLTRVNLSRQSSIDGFVDYMRKIFSNADYAQKIVGVKDKLVRAKKNIKTKIGIGQDGLSYELTALFSIDPSIIPDDVFNLFTIGDVFNKYEKIVTSFSARQTELSLPEASELKRDIAEINDALNTQNSLVGELTERFNSFEDKKTTEDGKVEYAATVKRMLKDKVITEEEAKLMTKFSKEINPREEKEGKSEEQKEKEKEEEKKELIQEVKDSEINVKAIDDKMSKQVAESLSEMIKTEAINELSNPQLKNLIKVINNINNGHLTHNAKLMIEALESSDDSDIGTDGVKNADPLKVGKELAKLKTLTRKGKDKNTFYKLLERNPLYFLDTVLGDATSKKIFNSVMEKPAEAFSKYNTELNKAYDEIDKAERLIIKHFKSDGNDVTFSKFKQMAYMVQEEFESNPNSNQVNPASEVLDATIEKLEETNQERNAEALRKIKKDFSTDGQIDLNKLMKSFSTAEKKMLKAIKEFNSSQTDKAVFTAAIIRGQAIDPLNNYVHQQVLSEGTDNIAAGSAFEDLSKMTDMFALNTKPSTKAKNLIDRTTGAKAINFDVVSATKRAAKMTLMDYHLTSPLRTANKTLNKMSDKLDKKGQQRQIFKGIKDGYNQAIRDALQVNFAADYSLFGKGIQVLTKNAYRGILAHSGRVGVEFLSNLSFAINNPRDFSQGVRHLDVALGSMGAEVMNNVDSKQTTRVYPSGLSGNYVDPNLITNNKGVVANEMKNPVVNKLNQAMALGPRRLTKGVEAIADTMLSGPDKVMMRPIWFGSFAREFASQVKNRKDLIMETAKMRKEGATDKQIKEYIDKETKVDFKKIAENDAEYMSKYKKEIREAKRKADDNSVLMGSTNNPLMGILKNTKRNSDTYAAAAYKNFNTFMQNFLLFEFNAFRRGWYTAMQGKTKEQKASGLLLMGAVSLRMMMYNVLMSYGFSLFFGGDDDKEEDSLETRVSRSFWNTFTGLLLGRDFGAAVKALIGLGVESVNKIHGEDLGIREGEYNPYKNSVQFNPLQMLIGKEKDEDTGEESWTIMSSKPKEVLAYRPVNVLSDIAPNFLGPLSPLAKTLSFGVNKVLLEEPKTTEEGKRKDELEEYRLLLEIGGHSGFVPFYKDFRNELLDEMYKDLGKKKKSSGKSSRPKRKSRPKRPSRPRRN